ncbi:hypothetical protein [Oceanobacillus senegalensis]|uniref:hypothetical protein n=1 Tax=Oceanobacillus senegalensis TaxID=1936063 RepID=UPI000A30BA3F|nr:hypothetical protein [Oceanobacillus senegalensis]
MIVYMLSILAFVLLCFELYKRYYPVKGIPCKDRLDKDTDIIELDIRDYNEKDISANVNIQIPYAYLRRNYKEIPNHPLHVIAANRMELNLGLRFLLKRGFHVSSFEILDCPCKEKGGIIDGV